MNKLIMALATGCFVGTIPKAPGTWGSLFAFLPWLAIKNLTLPWYLATIVISTIIGFLIAGSAEKMLDRPDPGCIVIDEIVGMFVTLILVPNHYLALLLAFGLFRLFDIAKPFPVSWFDSHFHGGIGIMLDDIMAGIYASLTLQLLWHFVFIRFI